MSNLVVVAPLRDGMRDAARALIAQGPPFALEGTPLSAHSIFLTEHVAVFVFEGDSARKEVETLLGDVGVWHAASAWRDCLAARPRLADEVFAWSRD
jgi:hypothetical protein